MSPEPQQDATAEETEPVAEDLPGAIEDDTPIAQPVDQSAPQPHVQPLAQPFVQPVVQPVAAQPVGGQPAVIQHAAPTAPLTRVLNGVRVPVDRHRNGFPDGYRHAPDNWLNYLCPVQGCPGQNGWKPDGTGWMQKPTLWDHLKGFGKGIGSRLKGHGSQILEDTGTGEFRVWGVLPGGMSYQEMTSQVTRHQNHQVIPVVPAQPAPQPAFQQPQPAVLQLALQQPQRTQPNIQHPLPLATSAIPAQSDALTQEIGAAIPGAIAALSRALAAFVQPQPNGQQHLPTPHQPHPAQLQQLLLQLRQLPAQLQQIPALYRPLPRLNVYQPYQVHNRVHRQQRPVQFQQHQMQIPQRPSHIQQQQTLTQQQPAHTQQHRSLHQYAPAYLQHLANSRHYVPAQAQHSQANLPIPGSGPGPASPVLPGHRSVYNPANIARAVIEARRMEMGIKDEIGDEDGDSAMIEGCDGDGDGDSAMTEGA